MEVKVSEFEQHIDSTILKRGLDYFKKGHVSEVEEIAGGEYEAIVEGTENYTVRLKIENGTIVENRCTCPYDMGPYCKHAVAVIFHLQKDELGIEKSKPRKATKRKTAQEKLEELLEEISHEELKNFVLKQAKADSSFRRILSAAFAYKTEKESKDLYKKQIKAIIKANAGRYGYIEPSGTTHIGNAVEGMLANAETQAIQGNFNSAFYIGAAVLEEMHGILNDADDSYGEIGSAIESAFQLFFNIAEEGLKEKDRMVLFNYYLTTFKSGKFSDWDWNTTLLSGAEQVMKTDAEAKTLIAILDKGNFSDYELSEILVCKLRIVEKIEGEKGAQAFINANLHNPKIREVALLQAMDEKDYRRVKIIANQGIITDEKQRPGYVNDWTNWLLKVAKAENSTDDIIKYARNLFIDSRRSEEDYYKLLKNTVEADQWDDFVEELITDIRKSGQWGTANMIADIYIKEGWWARLLELLQKSPSLEAVDAYAKYLVGKFPDEIFDMYTAGVRNFMDQQGSNRKNYQKLCQYLRRIIKHGGKDTVNILITEFKQKYPKRKALLEELNNV